MVPAAAVQIFVASPRLVPPASSRIEPEVSKMNMMFGRNDCAFAAEATDASRPNTMRRIEPERTT